MNLPNRGSHSCWKTRDGKNQRNDNLIDKTSWLWQPPILPILLKLYTRAPHSYSCSSLFPEQLPDHHHQIVMCPHVANFHGRPRVQSSRNSGTFCDVPLPSIPHAETSPLPVVCRPRLHPSAPPALGTTPPSDLGTGPATPLPL